MSSFSDTTIVNASSHDGGSPVPLNFDPMQYDPIMFDVDKIIPSLLTPLVLPPPVRELVCHIKTTALFAMTQASSQPQSVDAAAYSRVYPLPSNPTSSSSSVEQQLFIG